jgi:hypothetical protein
MDSLRVRPRCGPGPAALPRGRDMRCSAVTGRVGAAVVEVMQMRREPNDSGRLGPLER